MCCEQKYYSQTTQPSQTQFGYHQELEEHRRISQWKPYKTSEL